MAAVTAEGGGLRDFCRPPMTVDRWSRRAAAADDDA